MLKDDLKNNPFNVPESYFDSLPTRVQELCSASGSAKTGLWAMLKPQMGFAVGFGMLALVAYGGFSLIGSSANGVNPTVVESAAERQTNPAMYKTSTYVRNNPSISFANNQFNLNNSNTGLQTVDNEEMKETILNYLAVENISIDDILALE